jgi:hypothetical protein
MDSHNVVVGLDGTDVSLDAVQWAACASQETRTPLLVVHAYEPEPAPENQTSVFRAVTESWHRSRATQWLRQALDESPAVPYGVHLVLREQPWPEALLENGDPDTSLVVLGMTAEAAAEVASRAPVLLFPVVLVPPVIRAATPDRDVPTHVERPSLAGVSR